MRDRGEGEGRQGREKGDRGREKGDRGREKGEREEANQKVIFNSFSTRADSRRLSVSLTFLKIFLGTPLDK